MTTERQRKVEERSFVRPSFIVGNFASFSTDDSNATKPSVRDGRAIQYEWRLVFRAES